MGYGAVLGQTPILTAEGIEYDNSTTSGIITGNNVQQAIDQSANKIKQVENQIGNIGSQVAGKLEYVRLYNGNSSEQGKSGYITTDSTPFNTYISSYPLIVCEMDVDITASQDTAITIKYYSNQFGFNPFAVKQNVPIKYKFLLLLMIHGEYYYSTDIKVNDLRFSINASNGVNFNYNWNYTVYGLKAPTF